MPQLKPTITIELDGQEAEVDRLRNELNILQEQLEQRGV
jgi:hypothetical protein